MFAPEDILMSPRSEHSSILYGNEIVIFGGRGKNAKELNDAMCFNFITRKWRVLADGCTDSSPDKNFDQSIKEISRIKAIAKISDANFDTTVNEQKIPSPLSHGYSPKKASQRINDSKSFSPTGKGKIKGPPPKLKAIGIENDLKRKELLTPTTSAMLHSTVVHAGEKSLEPYLQTMKKRKRQQTLKLAGNNEFYVRGRIPYPRSGHSANLYGKYMIIFGGDRGQVALNDIFMCELNAL